MVPTAGIAVTLQPTVSLLVFAFGQTECTPVLYPISGWGGRRHSNREAPRDFLPYTVGRCSESDFISSRMSSTRQAVHRGVSLIGLGKRPDLTPSHQLVLPTGMTLSTCVSRKNPVSGMSCVAIVLPPIT